MNDVGMEIKRWTAKRKVQVVLGYLEGQNGRLPKSRGNTI